MSGGHVVKKYFQMYCCNGIIICLPFISFKEPFPLKVCGILKIMRHLILERNNSLFLSLCLSLTHEEMCFYMSETFGKMLLLVEQYHIQESIQYLPTMLFLFRIICEASL